jgi:hypothetical protein
MGFAKRSLIGVFVARWIPIGHRPARGFVKRSLIGGFVARWIPIGVPQASSGFVIAAYSRKELLQTGDGHYSPIGGYHAPSDSVLILDVARFKYPPHWCVVVPIGAGFESRLGF